VPPVVLGYSQVSARPPAVSLSLSLQPRLAPPADGGALEAQQHALSGEQEDVTTYARRFDRRRMHSIRGGAL
jgi:hypothetical protein